MSKRAEMNEYMQKKAQSIAVSGCGLSNADKVIPWPFLSSPVISKPVFPVGCVLCMCATTNLRKFVRGANMTVHRVRKKQNMRKEPSPKVMEMAN